MYIYICTFIFIYIYTYVLYICKYMQPASPPR